MFTKQEKESPGIKLSEFLPLVLDYLKQCIMHIDTKYLWSVNPNFVLFLLSVSAILLLIIPAVFL